MHTGSRLLLLLSVTLAACGAGSTDVDSSALEYRAPIAGTFAEVFSYTGNTGGPKQCTVYSTLSGTVRVKLDKPGDIAGADAGVDITERVVGAAPPRDCSSSREVRPFGEWTAPIQGTASHFTFTTSRSSSGQTTTISFDGSLVNNTVTGTLKFVRNTPSLNGGTAGSATGTTEFPVSFQLTQPPAAALNGTWVGTLTFGLNDGSATRGTTMTLTQTGSTVTGQLQFAGGEVDNVEGTISGSTLAITATPRPVGDNCDRYSFGITFIIESNQLRSTAAAGNACESGGALLRQFKTASGTLSHP